MKAKVAIIGNGNVGGALGRGCEQAGYEVKSVGNEPARVRELAEWGELIVLAVPFPAVDEVIQQMGDAVNDKIVIDVTNALTPDFRMAIGFNTSGAEELQKKAPSAVVVKAFNTVFAEHMATGQVKHDTLSLFVASDDQSAKDQVLAMGRDISFDAVDAGPLENARWLEALGYLNIQLGYMLNMGTEIGFKLIH